MNAAVEPVVVEPVHRIEVQVVDILLALVHYRIPVVVVDGIPGEVGYIRFAEGAPHILVAVDNLVVELHTLAEVVGYCTEAVLNSEQLSLENLHNQIS